MSIAAINLKTNMKLPPTLEVARRVGEVIGLESMHASFDTDYPLHGGMTGRYKGKQYMIRWRPHTLTNTQDRTKVPVVMFEAMADWMNTNLQWFLPCVDMMNVQQRKRFAQGMGNRMLDGIADFEAGRPDISQLGHWTDDEDIRVENIEKAVDKLKKIEKKDEGK